jgi:type IV pilus assembly protein PilB
VDLVSTAPPSRGPAAHAKDLLESRDDTAHAIAVLDALLLDAIAERASDIHLEIYNEVVRVRMRIDGDLHDVSRFRLAPDELRAVVNVIKVAAELDIAEKRLPQGGRFRRQAGDQTFDLRVQTQPALWGEHVVVRLLPQEMKPLSIEDLGFPSRSRRSTCACSTARPVSCWSWARPAPANRRRSTQVCRRWRRTRRARC